MCVSKNEIWRCPYTHVNTQNMLYKQKRNLLVRSVLQTGIAKKNEDS